MSPPMEVRGMAGAFRLIALNRRVSLTAFFAFLSPSPLVSLLIASEIALLIDARFNECRIDDLVDGLGRWPLEPESELGMFEWVMER